MGSLECHRFPMDVCIVVNKFSKILHSTKGGAKFENSFPINARWMCNIIIEFSDFPAIV